MSMPAKHQGAGQDETSEPLSHTHPHLRSACPPAWCTRRPRPCSRGPRCLGRGPPQRMAVAAARAQAQHQLGARERQAPPPLPPLHPPPQPPPPSSAAWAPTRTAPGAAGAAARAWAAITAAAAAGEGQGHRARGKADPRQGALAVRQRWGLGLGHNKGWACLVARRAHTASRTGPGEGAAAALEARGRAGEREQGCSRVQLRQRPRLRGGRQRPWRRSSTRATTGGYFLWYVLMIQAKCV